MRTTIDLPEQLIDEAIKLSHQKTKTAVIIAALEDFIRKKRIEGLKKFKGQVPMEINLDTLRNRS
jgi:hypothetical protein